MTARLLAMPRKTLSDRFDVPNRPRALSLLARVIDRLYDKQEAAAIDLGVSPGQLSKWLSGKEKFGLADLDRVRAIRAEYARLLAEDSGYIVRALSDDELRRRLITQKQRELFELMQEDARVSA